MLEKAAEAYRLDQARTIIRAIRQINDNGDAKLAFLSINEKTGTSYRTYSDVVDNADLQHAVLRAAERDLRAWEARYQELTDVCSMVSDARLVLSDRLKAA